MSYFRLPWNFKYDKNRENDRNEWREISDSLIQTARDFGDQTELKKSIVDLIIQCAAMTVKDRKINPNPVFLDFNPHKSDFNLDFIKKFSENQDAKEINSLIISNLKDHFCNLDNIKRKPVISQGLRHKIDDNTNLELHINYFFTQFQIAFNTLSHDKEFQKKCEVKTEAERIRLKADNLENKKFALKEKTKAIPEWKFSGDIFEQLQLSFELLLGSRFLYHTTPHGRDDLIEDQDRGFRFGFLDLVIFPLLIDAIFLASFELFHYGCNLILQAKKLISGSDYLAGFFSGLAGLLFCISFVLPAFAAVKVYPVFCFFRASLAAVLSPFLLAAIKIGQGTSLAFKLCFFKEAPSQVELPSSSLNPV